MTTVIATRAARRALDIALSLLIAFVLLMVVLSRGLPIVTGGTTLVIAGGSMEPAIPLGSLVHAAPVDPTALRVGDVVTLQAGPDRAVFTHRIVRLATLADGLYIETRGDANATVDPSLVPMADVIGRVELSIPVLGFGLALMSSIQGILFLLSMAGVLLAGAWLLESVEDEQLERLRLANEGAHGSVSVDASVDAVGAA